MRILLFLATNLAVILVASFTLRLLGVDSYLAQQGIDYGSLLAFAAVFGFAGAFISLFLSKPMAKWSTKARVIDSPRTPAERWLRHLDPALNPIYIQTRSTSRAGARPVLCHKG